MVCRSSLHVDCCALTFCVPALIALLLGGCAAMMSVRDRLCNTGVGTPNGIVLPASVWGLCGLILDRCDALPDFVFITMASDATFSDSEDSAALDAELGDFMDLSSPDDSRLTLDFCRHAMSKGALALSHILPSSPVLKAKGNLREHCTFYLLVHLMAFGVYDGVMQRSMKEEIVGAVRPSRKTAGDVPLRPCKWGDKKHKAPTLIETDSLTYRTENAKLFCARLAVPTSVVLGKASPHFKINPDEAFKIVSAGVKDLLDLKVRLLELTVCFHCSCDGCVQEMIAKVVAEGGPAKPVKKRTIVEVCRCASCCFLLSHFVSVVIDLRPTLGQTMTRYVGAVDWSRLNAPKTSLFSFRSWVRSISPNR